MSERDLFLAAFDLPAADRGRYLAERCGGDPDLRRRVDGLLAAHAAAGFLDAPPAAEPLLRLLAPSDRPGALGRAGHYDVLAVLGRGGFGVVVRAFDTVLQRVVAIKFLDPLLAGTSPPRQRFLREARAVARIAHEHVVRVHAVEELPVPFLVMEYVGGGSLQDLLDATGPLPPAEVAGLGRQVALGLAAAHAQGLIHRDVKPANVLLESGVERRAKLTDFGLARAADDASLTHSGVVAGTPLYMAPEQARGETLDPRADLFSLGSVLYAMTTGRPPFRAANTLAVLKRVVEDAPRPPGEVIDGVPPGLAAVIARLMAKRPADRYPTAEAAAAALADCLTAPPARPWGRGRRAVAAAVVLLAAGGGVAVLAGRDRPAVGPGPAAAGLVVTSTRDDGSDGTLRWAVGQANARPGEDTITFDPGVFAGPQTIALARGPLPFLDPARTTVVGPAGGLTVSGEGRCRVIEVGGPGRPAVVQVVDLTIARGQSEFNGPDQYGGGVLVRAGADLELVRCTLRDNVAQDGGGVYTFGVLALTNCTLAGNHGTGEGGGVKSFGMAARTTVVGCTFVGNRSPVGSGLLNHGGSRCLVSNSLFVGESDRCIRYSNPEEAITGDHNLTSDDSAPGDHSLRNTDARLGPLGRYGGPTETFPLATGSPARDAGSNDLVPAGVVTDQRGKPRVADGRVDIGAFEVNP